MPKYEVSVGDSKYQVDAPDEATAWSWANYTHSNQPAPPPPPEGGFIPAVQRGFLQTGSLLFDILPAMGARLIGADAYAEKQFQEAAATEKKIQEKYGAAVPSYKDIKGAGDFVTYITESVGELIPSILPSLFTGGLAGIASRGAVLAAKEAAEAAARREICSRNSGSRTTRTIHAAAAERSGFAHNWPR